MFLPLFPTRGWRSSSRRGEEERPPFGVPPSEEGRSGNLGPPPPVFRDLGGGQGDEPPPYRVGDVQQPPRQRRWWPRILIAFAALLVLFILANIGIDLYVNRLWFRELGYGSVFTTRIGTQIWLFFAAFGLAFAFLLSNIILAWRIPLAGSGVAASPFREVSYESLRRMIFIAGIVVVLFIAIVFGSVASARWERILLFQHAQPFGLADPQFGRDVGFYVFKLETLQFIKSWAIGLVMVSLIAALAVYALRMLLHAGSAGATRPLRVHVAILIAVTMALFAWGYWLARFELAVSDNGIVFGATYTDVHVRNLALWVMVGIGALVAVAVLSWPLHERLAIPGGALALLAVGSVVGTLILPAIVQRVTVDPNELEREQQYIARNIAATRAAFGLERIEERPFAANDEVSEADAETNPEALQNVRVWDHRPLGDTLNTIQTIRPLYAFPDVDVDRYQVDGVGRQVFLGARELSHSNLQPNQQSWVNRRLQFTHGFGLTVSPVDEVTFAGGPSLWLSNIPPEASVPGGNNERFELTQPRIYYGEITDPYVIANTNSEEFDYPLTADAPAQGADEDGLVPEEQITNRYDGAGGIEVGGFLRRLAFAWQFSDTNILISGSLSSESRILFRRDIRERVGELAPFLQLDHDPYIVIGEDGRLYWILDAYTISDRYPYAEPHSSGVNSIPAGTNYVRNSVKAVVDAYHGTVTLYLVDEGDPIVRAWAEIFPDLFQPAEAFPADLRAHWRYPQDFFLAQAEQYLTYHIASPRTLFNREDMWAIPREVLQDRQIPVEPYYITLRLPDEEEEEFLLIVPFTPRNRTNAIAWLAGRSDGENYGRLFAFRFPRNRNVNGPAQIEARIDQDVAVSRQFTLLGQQGSDVIRGNLLFIPVGSSYIYVEPIYLQAENQRFPQLKGVIVVNGDRIALEETFGEAVAVALGQRAPTGLAFGIEGEAVAGQDQAGVPPGLPGEEPGTDGPAEPEAPPPDDPGEPSGEESEATGDASIDALVQEAQDAYEQARLRLAEGDFAGYGAELDRLKAALDRLEAATQEP